MSDPASAPPPSVTGESPRTNPGSAKERSGPSPPARRLAWPLLTSAALLMAGISGYFSLHTVRQARELESGHRTALEKLGILEMETGAARREFAAARRDLEFQRTRQARERRDQATAATEKMLENRPPGGGALSGWSAAAGPLTAVLESALENADEVPALTVENTAARWQLARLQMALSHDTAALPQLERLARDLTAAAADAPANAPPDAVENRKLLTARTAAQRGRILTLGRRVMDAAPLLREASALYEDWLTGNTEDRGIAREYARNSLYEGRVLTERRQPDDARNAFLRIAGLLGRPGDEGFSPEDRLLLAEAALETAVIEINAGRSAPAAEQHMQAIRLLVDYDRRNPESVPCRTLLVRGYTGLGRLLSKSGAVRDAGIAFMEAVKLLTALTKELPHETSWRLQLALTYDEVARLVRASKPGPAGAKEALDYQNGSVTFLRNLNEASVLDPQWRRPLAESLVLNGELQEATGAPAVALERYREALNITAALLESGNTLSDIDLRACRRLAGRAQNAAGALHEKAGRKKEAAAAFTQALKEWELTFSPGNEADAETKRTIALTKERIRKLTENF